MSPVYAFVATWIVVLLVWLALDRLGNPNRGRFRPLGYRHRKRGSQRRLDRVRRRREDDAQVRSALRQRYGRSSLRLRWNDKIEERSVHADEQLLVSAGVLTTVAPPSHDKPIRAWKRGADPLALTLRGTPPAPSTVRARVWKNRASSGSWGDPNRERMRAGKAPRRDNPITGRAEFAVVDVKSGTGSWPDDAIDPFGTP